MACLRVECIRQINGFYVLMLFQTRKAMDKLTEALDTMQDALMAAQTLGQPPGTVERDGVALAVSRVGFYKWA
jgi:hypothetical protein